MDCTNSDCKTTDLKNNDCCPTCKQNIIRCELCKVYFKRKSNLDAHNKSMHHMLKVQQVRNKFRYRELEELSKKYPGTYSGFAVIGMIEVYLKSVMITDKRRATYDCLFEKLKKLDADKLISFNDVDNMITQ